MLFLFLHISDNLLSYYYFNQRVHDWLCMCVWENERRVRMQENVKMINLCVNIIVVIVLCFFFHWCHVEFSLCCLCDVRLHQVYKCLNRHETLETSYILGMERVPTAKCRFRKDHYRTQSLQVTIFAAWESGCYSHVGAEHCLASAERDCSFSCCSTLQHYDANEKKVIWLRNKISRSSVFFFFLSNGTFNATSHELFK